MKFLTDENFAYGLNALLKAFDRDNEICALTDYFPRGTKDLVWIPEVGAWPEKPFIVSGDGRILRNKVERQALKQSGCSYVYLATGWTETPWDMLCVKLITYWPKVVDLAKRTNQQAVLELSRNGRLDRVNL